MGARHEKAMERKAMSKESERQRRERAQQHAGDVVAGSGRVIEPRRLDHMISVRLEPELVTRLRRMATENGMTLSDILRRAASLLIAEEERSHAPIVRLSVVNGNAPPTPGTTTSNPIKHEPRSQSA